MKLKYKYSYLTDRTKVKITKELFEQIKTWRNQDEKLDEYFIDELKRQEDRWINKYLQYYRKNVSLDAALEKESYDVNLISDPRTDIENQIIVKERKMIINTILDKCTAIQKRRFIKHYYLDYKYIEIAQQERCTEGAIRKSICAVEKMLINYEYLL